MTDTTNFNIFSALFVQRLICGTIFWIVIFSSIIIWPLTIYLLTTDYWWLALLYFLWFYSDWDTPEKGGRPISWIKNSFFYKPAITYFNADVTFASGFHLDQKRNYLFCYCPHGVIPTGFHLNIVTAAGKFHQTYPNFKVSLATIKLMFAAPFLREWNLGMGLISCSATSISYVLSKTEGSHVVALNTGGSAEAFYSEPGKYLTVVKNRKGFVKLALQHGTPLVPVITFGECDQFYQVKLGKWKSVQKLIRRKLHFSPIFFYGTGFCLKYGIVPRKVPFKSVVGVPIDVEKVENPTCVQIDKLHKKYMKELVDLFETYKHQFLENPNETNLILM